MYTGDHVDSRICAVCGDTVTPPSDDGCLICWHGAERGLLVYDDSTGGWWVHRHCLDAFDCESLAAFERQYLD